MNLLPSRDEMDKAFLSSDESYNGLFFTAVRTTGIFCLPSCPARKPLPKNVEFFATVKEAMFAGYRACKRCRPTDTSAPEWAQTLLARVDREPETRIKEQELRAMGLEPARVRRHFLNEYGMTFQAYCRARRLGQAFDQIRGGAPLDHAILDSGFDSHSGFRTAFARLFGKPPGKTRGGDCVRLAWIETAVGPMIAGSVSDGVCLLEFTDRRMLETQLQRLSRCFPFPVVPGESAHLLKLQTELAEYFSGARQNFTVPLVYPGTPFEQTVWSELLRIPYGETRSYEALAQTIGQRGASRAVGRANGMNRISILIPCHRVVNKNGELGGYGGGLWRKRILLDLERTHQPLNSLRSNTRLTRESQVRPISRGSEVLAEPRA
ncbi:MAG: methylated-DNA--[protein]-cysteine S-methyltransferase [Acidobacteriota bacterium]|nr:methylated-DNA--[protein]-cysteine S-methyltransferase [Acidobacteriota bacterium]